jgi:hypothetical protein
MYLLIKTNISQLLWAKEHLLSLTSQLFGLELKIREPERLFFSSEKNLNYIRFFCQFIISCIFNNIWRFGSYFPMLRGVTISNKSGFCLVYKWNSGQSARIPWNETRKRKNTNLESIFKWRIFFVRNFIFSRQDFSIYRCSTYYEIILLVKFFIYIQYKSIPSYQRESYHS